MSNIQVIEIEDSGGITLRVEFDGADLSASIHGTPDGELPTVGISPEDRAALRDFLTTAHVPGRH